MIWKEQVFMVFTTGSCVPKLEIELFLKRLFFCCCFFHAAVVIVANPIHFACWQQCLQMCWYVQYVICIGHAHVSKASFFKDPPLKSTVSLLRRPHICMTSDGSLPRHVGGGLPFTKLDSKHIFDFTVQISVSLIGRAAFLLLTSQPRAAPGHMTPHKPHTESLIQLIFWLRSYPTVHGRVYRRLL